MLPEKNLLISQPSDVMAGRDVSAFEDPPTGAYGSSDSDPTAEGLFSAGPVSGVHSNPPLFEEGRIVAGRYRILKFLARGGMGEVYEAMDLDLGELIALKSIGSDQVHSDDAIQRFKRELSLARKVTHPNVCRTYDLVHHHQPDGTRVACLSMELLTGESLARRLRHGGRMDSSMALSLAQQMAAALEAAHAVGVIHRDLKPSNVMLVKIPSGEGSMRAVITDFGLAFSQEYLDRSIPSAPGTFQGTLAYMSPEQVEGGPITPRSDIYSLGLVIFEMLTGEVPFRAGNPVSAATRRLKEAAPSPRAYVDDLEPWWEKVLARSLARNPEDRYSSAKEFLEALDPDPPAILRSPRHKGRTLAVASAAALLLGGGGMVAWRSANGAAPFNGFFSRSSLRPSIAVLGLENLSQDPKIAWRGRALAEMLGTELSLDEKVRLIPGPEVARMCADLRLPGSPELSRPVLQRIRQNLGSDLLISGSYVNAGTDGAFRVDLKLLDARTGEVLSTVREQGSDQEILGIVHRAGQKMRGRLGFGEEPAEAVGMMVASYPLNTEAMRNFSEALDRLRKFDALGAKELLEKALAAQPRFALAHAALSEAWTQLGSDAKAKDEAKLAMDQSAGLSREDRLRTEVQGALADHQWDKAIAAYQALYGFFPDNLDYGLGLARAQRMGSKFRDAEATLQGLLQMPKPIGDDPRIDLERASLAYYQGDIYTQEDSGKKAVQQSLALSVQARAKAELRGAKVLGVLARSSEASALKSAGDLQGASSQIVKALAEVSELGQPLLDARLHKQLGWLGVDRGDYPTARKEFQRSMEISRRCGQGIEEVSAITGMAAVLFDEGDLEGAQRLSADAIERSRALGNQLGAAMARDNSASWFLSGGQLQSAKQGIEEVQSWAKTSGNPTWETLSRTLKGQLAWAEGHPVEAKSLLVDSVAKWDELGDRLLGPFALVLLGRVLHDMGDEAGARCRFNEALEIQNRSGAKFQVASTCLELGRFELEVGRLGEAQAKTQRALAIFESLGLKEGKARAQILLSRVILAQGHVVEARQVFPADYQGQSLDWRIAANLQRARLEPNDRKAMESLRKSSALAQKSGYAPLFLETRLVVADLTPSAAGRDAALKIVGEEAHSTGYHGFAKQAELLKISSAAPPK